MNSRMARLAFVLTTAVSACKGQQACSTGMDCPSGTCYPSTRSSSKFCLARDAACPSGLRWSNNAGDGLANICVAGAGMDMASTRDQSAPPYDLASHDDFGFQFPDLGCPPNVGVPQNGIDYYLDTTVSPQQLVSSGYTFAVPNLGE